MRTYRALRDLVHWLVRVEAKLDAILKLNGQDPRKVDERLPEEHRR